LLYELLNNNPNYGVYTLNLEPLNSIKSHGDIRIELTIQYALKKFFENNKNALIAIIDSGDGRQQARSRLFKRWYRNSNIDNIEKIDVECKTEDVEIIATLFLEKSNPFKTEIKSSFAELVKLNFYY